MYADDTELLAESEGMLQRIVDEFDRVCRRKLKVNAGESKEMVFEKSSTRQGVSTEAQFLRTIGGTPSGP